MEWYALVEATLDPYSSARPLWRGAGGGEVERCRLIEANTKQALSIMRLGMKNH